MLTKTKNQIQSKISKKTIFIFTFLSILGLVLVYLFIFYLLPVDRFLKSNNISYRLLFEVVLNKNNQLKTVEGRTNIVLLGIAGQGHEGSDLTDTILFISIDFRKSDILISSIPRDIWLDDLKDKINTAYHYGEEKEPGGGFKLAKNTSETVIGKPIQYAFLLDFTGFERLVDLVGGLDINVDNSFVDNKYPITGKENDTCGGDKEYKCRYETVIFQKGWQHMDGKSALQFARSRNAQGDEGTDFARSKRQQKILLAFKGRLFSAQSLNKTKMNELVGIIKNTVKSDADVADLLYLGRNYITFKGNIRNISLSEETKDMRGLLINPPNYLYNKWVLIPKDKNFSQIHEYFDCFLKDPECLMKAE